MLLLILSAIAFIFLLFYFIPTIVVACIGGLIIYGIYRTVKRMFFDEGSSK